MKTQKQLLGQQGEEIAVAHLLEKGYSILERNYRYGQAEIDIIAINQKQLIIVEVKTRYTDRYGLPEVWVTDKKQFRIARATEAYLRKNRLNLTVRYDIMSIIKNQYKTEITHLIDAFWPGLY